MTGDPATWKRDDARHHDREAEFYDRLIGREYEPYQHTHTAYPWSRHLAAHDARLVLDLGGGTGRTALPVAAAGAAVIVADTSRGMLRRAAAKARAAGHGRVWLLVADAEHLPLPTAAVDGVVCQGVLHHLPDVAGALAESDRVLRRGGWLCLAEPDARGSRLADGVRRWARRLRPLLAGMGGRRSPAATHERALEPKVMLDPLTRWGYTIHTWHVVHPPYLYRYLPLPLGRWLAAWLNRADEQPRRGDILVVRAQKRAASPLDTVGSPRPGSSPSAVPADLAAGPIIRHRLANQ